MLLIHQIIVGLLLVYIAKVDPSDMEFWLILFGNGLFLEIKKRMEQTEYENELAQALKNKGAKLIKIQKEQNAED